MYAENFAAVPVRQFPRATAVTFDDATEQQPSARESIGGRVLVYCVAGTFGLLLPAYVQASTSTSNWEINQIEVDGSRTATENSESQTVKEINHVRQVTNISVSELARVCGVSRQAVHEWIKGGPLSPKNAQRISDLAQAVDVLLVAGVEPSAQALRRKVSGDASILEAVQVEGKAINLAQQLVGTLARESEQRKQLTARLTNRRSELNSAEFGAPHLNEKT